MATFGERLKLLREEKELSQDALAKQFHFSQSIIAHYEAGRKFPSQQTLWQMADFFNVTIDYLLGRTDIRTPKDPDEPTPAEIEDVIRKADLQFDGAPLNEQDKEEIIEFIRLVLKRHKKRQKENE